VSDPGLTPPAGSRYPPLRTDSFIDFVWLENGTHTNRASSPLTAVLIEQYGGAASRVGTTDTAFAQRHAQYDLGILTQWADPAESSRHIAWTRGFAEAMGPFASGDYLLNFLGEESDDIIRFAFGANHARLVEV
jgi:hypothetical protein